MKIEIKKTSLKSTKGIFKKVQKTFLRNIKGVFKKYKKRL